METQDTILILDFGSPYNQELTRRIREVGVYSELHPHDMDIEDIKKLNPKGIILSGGPHAVGDVNNYQADRGIYDLNIPILGICYGMQLILTEFSGTVQAMTEREYEEVEITLNPSAPLFKGLNNEETVYLSKGVEFSVSDEFTIDGVDKLDHAVAISHKEKAVYGLNFYPEKQETQNGLTILKTFALDICKCAGS